MYTLKYENFGGTIIKLRNETIAFEGPVRSEGDKALFLVCRVIKSLPDTEQQYPEPIQNYLDRFELAWENHKGKNVIFYNEEVESAWNYYLEQERKEYLELAKEEQHV